MMPHICPESSMGILGSIVQKATGVINYNFSDTEQREKLKYGGLSEQTVARDGNCLCCI
jgi:hypothetical protein